MNPGIFLALIGVGIIMVVRGANASSPSDSGNTPISVISDQNTWGLPDIDSSNQGGDFDTTYDEAFEKASGATGVPFALIKAHAIRESSLDPNASHQDSSTQSSYGLLQIEWSANMSSSLFNRLSKYGSQYSGANIAAGASVINDPDTNAFLGACIIKDNLNWLTPNGKNGMQGLRDAINAYNTGTTESKHPAPVNYVNDVLAYYSKIINQNVSV